MNHHQLALADRLYEKLGENNYYFIQTEEVEAERIKLGWHTVFDRPYIINAFYDTDKKLFAQKIADDADVVIIGGCKNPVYYLAKRRDEKKVIIRYSERLLKKGLYQTFSPRRRYLMKQNCISKNEYLLCASGYAAFDFSLFNMYKGKTFKWGYFPIYKDINWEEIVNKKTKKDTIEIMWAGRFLDWKHPDHAIKAVSKIKEKYNNLHLSIVGNGILENELRHLVEEKKMTDIVTFYGSVSPETVRTMMEQADIYLFTSDYNEGWGAVLNEAMNSACAVVVSHAVGAAPYLVKNRKNALLYKSEDVDMLSNAIEELIVDNELRQYISKNALLTIKTEWNAIHAADNLIDLMMAILNKNPKLIPKNGPCSEDKCVPQWRMYTALKKNTYK